MKRRVNYLIGLVFAVEVIGIFLFGIIAFYNIQLRTHSEISNAIFFQNGSDRFMDFFNLFRDFQGWDAYERHACSYSPLIILFFKVVGNWLIPLSRRDGAMDRYLMQGLPVALIIYFAFIGIVLLMVVFAAYRKMRGKNPIYIGLIVLLIFLSYPVQWGFERGNVVLFSMGTLALFFGLYGDENRHFHELSYIALAISIVTKIYPLFFVLVILRRKDWLGFVKVGCYSAILMFVPFIFYDGIQGFHYMYYQLTYFNQHVKDLVRIAFLEGEAEVVAPTLMETVLAFIADHKLLLLVLSIIFFDKDYQAAMVAAIAFRTFDGAAILYSVSLFAPIFILMLGEKEKDLPLLLMFPLLFQMLWFTQYDPNSGLPLWDKAYAEAVEKATYLLLLVIPCWNIARFGGWIFDRKKEPTGSFGVSRDSKEPMTWTLWVRNSVSRLGNQFALRLSSRA